MSLVNDIMNYINRELGTIVSIGTITGWGLSYWHGRGLKKRLAELIKQHLFEGLILRTLEKGKRMSLADLETKVIEAAKVDTRRQPRDMSGDVLNKWAKGSFAAALEILKQDGIGLVKTDFEQLHYLSTLGETLVKRLQKQDS